MTATAESSTPILLLYGFRQAEAFVAVASELREKGFQVIAACRPADAAAIAAARALGCHVVEADRDHQLRAGMERFAAGHMDLPGMVAVDLSLGYSAEDVLATAQALRDNPDKFVIAAREGRGELSLYARLERWVARLAFLALHGRRVRDPWTGLRAIPAHLVPAFLSLKDSGKRFAFDMLINMQHMGVKCAGAPVNTAERYAPGTGFWSRAVDTLTILLLPIKFFSSSLTATGVDNAIYLLMTNIIYPKHWIVALTVCRSAGAVTGYLLNRNVVFRQKNNTLRKELISLLKYAILWGFNFGMSILLVGLFHKVLNIQNIVAKLMSDAILFTLSYTVQREVIFRQDAPSAKE